MDLKVTEEIRERPAKVDRPANVGLPARQEIFQPLLDQSVCKDRQEKEVSSDHRALKVRKDSAVSPEKLDLLDRRAKTVHLANGDLKEIAETEEPRV